MDHFNYKGQELYAEEVKISDIAKILKPPFYLYSQATFSRHYKVMDQAISLPNKLIAYAVKSCGNLSIIKILADLGAGADVVSGGEIFKARKAGIAADKIVFSGVGKTEEEIKYGLKEGICQFNCESKEELLMIDKIAADLKKQAAIAIRINPNVDANTHAKISTGKKGDKFGIDIDVAPEVIKLANSLENIDFKGISVHIGSQITQLEVFERAFRRVFEFVQDFDIKTIDLGGGLGVPYDDDETIDPESYGNLITNLVKEYNLENKKFIFEPGRVIAANAGIVVSSIILIKETELKNFAVCDVAMNDLMRPALYDSIHQFIPVNQEDNAKSKKYDFVGAVCETTDVFIKDLEFPQLKPGDLFAIRSAGAYGAVLSNEYNVRPLIPEILVNGDKFQIIRKRPSYEEMIAKEDIADWL